MSRDFPGSGSNYFTIGDVAATQPSGAFSIACWFKQDTSQSGCLVGKWNNTSTRSFLFDMSNTQVLAFNILGANATGYGGTKSGYSVGNWAHGAGVFTGASGTITAYLDGVAGTPTAVANTVIRTSAISTRVGFRPTNDFPFDGKIAEVAMWHAALSTAEIAALAKGVSPLQIRKGSLKGYWPLWGVGAPEVDFSSFGVQLALTGTVPAAAGPPVGKIRV